jgi:hypothetical protein
MRLVFYAPKVCESTADKIVEKIFNEINGTEPCQVRSTRFDLHFYMNRSILFAATNGLEAGSNVLLIYSVYDGLLCRRIGFVKRNLADIHL